ncbi:MAG: RecX family transcriptional regulator [Pedobacter sp.]|nr:MAG: RecX family transcriptional regulator [Pedobacter sp.]
MDIKATIFSFCNYQERSHQEVRNKLYDLGYHKAEVESVLSDLIEVGLLNEERFARSFARGKFRMLHWGRIKIIQHLKQHRVSDYCIKKGLSEIDDMEYIKTLCSLGIKKAKELKSVSNPKVKESKIYNFLSQKGFESRLIVQEMSGILNYRD